MTVPITRRGLFAHALAALVTSVAVRAGQSSDGVPRRVDLRAQDSAPRVPVRVWLNGVEQKSLVAYDLDACTITRWRLSPDGRPVFAPLDQWVTERGELVVRWIEQR